MSRDELIVLVGEQAERRGSSGRQLAGYVRRPDYPPEHHPEIASRAVLTERAWRWAFVQVGRADGVVLFEHAQAELVRSEGREPFDDQHEANDGRDGLDLVRPQPRREGVHA